MKAGFHTVYLAQRPLDVAAYDVAAAGYTHIELNAERLPYAEPHVGPLAPAGSTEAAARATRDAGLQVSAIGAHCELLSMDPREALAYGCACIEVAEAVGAPVVHVLSGARPSRMSHADALARCAEYAAALIEQGRGAGVTVAWEAIVGMAIASSEHMLELLDAVGPALGVNFDPSHLHLTDGDAVAAAGRLGPRVVNLHVKDATARPNGHAFPPLGEGEIDLSGVVDALRVAGYDGVATVEWEAHAVGGYPRDDTIALHASRAYLRDRLGI